MMKKITRIAALLAATALLFGAIGCSDDDGDDPTLENIAISIDEKAVKTEYAVNEQFDPAGITVTATYSDDSTKDVTADATFTATCDGKPFTTATAGGPFDVTLTATYGEITSEPVSCKITVNDDSSSNDNDNDNNKTELNGSENTGGENTGGDSTGGESTDTENPGTEKVTSFKVDFTAMSADKFGEGVTFSSTATEGKYEVPAGELTLDKAVLHSEAAKNFIVRSKNGACTGINYNGGDVGDMSNGSLAKEPDRYIGVNIGGAGTLAVSYKSTHKTSDVAENKCQIAFVTEDGKVLKCQTVQVGSKGVEDTLTYTMSASEAGKIAVVFSRNGTVKPNTTTLTGGIDVYDIEFTAAK